MAGVAGLAGLAAGSGLNLFGFGGGGHGFGGGGFGGGIGAGQLGVLEGGSGPYNPGFAWDRDLLLTTVEYNYMNGMLYPEDLEVLDVIQMEEQTEEMTSLASFGSLCGGVTNTIVGGCGLPTPFLCYIAQPVTVPIYTPTQLVVSTEGTPATTYVSGPVVTEGAPQVAVTDGQEVAGIDPISIPADPGPLQPDSTDAESPVADSNPSVVDADAAEPENKIVLTNPEGSGGAVSYDLSGFAYTIKPGNVQTLTTRPSWVVTFDRGGEFGQAAYTLTSGTYTFTPTEKGWDLVETTYEIALDNSKNDSDFNYLRNGIAESVKAGQTLTVSHKYPHQILFDRGDGGEPGERILERGFYSIGIEEKSGLYDIVPAEDSPAVDAPSSTPAANP